MRLYHFCCDHAAAHIEAERVVRPMIAWRTLDRLLSEPTGLAAAPAVYWATPLGEPNRDDVGLTSKTLTCDRMERRFVLDDPPNVMPWLLFAAMHGAHRSWTRTLSGTPDQWWVGITPATIGLP